jgi:uncharacterized membrane protein YeaQ/YmgE (transglycosylase-associated protein family)
MKVSLQSNSTLLSAFLVLALGIFSLTLVSRASGAEGVTEKVNAATTEAEKKLQEAQETAKNHWEALWRRIDEARLKNRTPDQIVAWVIMGLLVGGLIHQFSKFKKITTLLLGLAGAFVGGIVANVTQFDLKLGPVLIRYEDLLSSLVGGLMIILIARWFASRRSSPK